MWYELCFHVFHFLYFLFCFIVKDETDDEDDHSEIEDSVEDDITDAGSQGHKGRVNFLIAEFKTCGKLHKYN